MRRAALERSGGCGAALERSGGRLFSERSRVRAPSGPAPYEAQKCAYRP